MSIQYAGNSGTTDTMLVNIQNPSESIAKGPSRLEYEGRLEFQGSVNGVYPKIKIKTVNISISTPSVHQLLLSLAPPFIATLHVTALGLLLYLDDPMPLTFSS